MSQDRLQATIQHYRQQLLQHEAQAEAALEHAYAHTLKMIQPRLDALYRQIEALQADGEEIPISWLYEEKRLSTLTSFLSGQIDHFGSLAQMTTVQMQRQGTLLGGQAAQALLQASAPKGISWAFGVPDPRAIANIIGATQKGSPLSDLFAGFGAEAAQKAANALILGITNGDNPRTIAGMMQDALGVSRNRALVIARDQMLDAYRSSQFANYRANSDVVSQWRWTCDLSPRTCPACLAQDGTLHDLDEDLDEHVCGRCSPIPVTRSWSDIFADAGLDGSDIEESSPVDDMQSGADWFANQSEDVQQQVLGKAKYAAFSDGQFQLSDLVGHAHDKDWGGSIYERSLADTLAAAEKAASATVEAAVKAFDPLQGTLAEKAHYLGEHGLNEWLSGLSADERKSITAYTKQNYRTFNRALRKGGQVSDRVQSTIDQLQQTLLTSSAPTDLQVSRGYGWSLLETFQSMQPGDTFVEQGFCSTTLMDDATFSGFSVNIQIQKGAPGAYIQSLSSHPNEAEYLLPHGAEFTLVSSTQDDTGNWIFTVAYQGLADTSS